MKRRIVVTALAIGLLVIIAVSVVPAAEQTKLWAKMCATCHDGTTAIDREGLRDKYPTVDDFTAAVLAKGNPCMNILKNDKKLIKKIANEIGITDTKARK